MPRERETVVTVVTEAPLTPSHDSGGDGCIVVFYGENLGKRYFLNRPELIIGRSESTQIQVDQDSVSRQHAKIVTVGAQSRLFDLGSTNGTFVNDRQVEEVELRDGDLVRIGQTIFKYLSGSNIEAKYHEEIYQLTTVDGMTQTFNRRYFLDSLQRELNRSIRYDRALSLAMLDIDHFKQINDKHGHLGGDFVLRELAALVRDNVRREDIFARYGGEEFSLILPEIDSEGAARVCEKLRAMIEKYHFIYERKEIPVTVSFGIRTTITGEKLPEVESFIADADRKLYEAKQSGRNRVCV